MDKKYCIFDMDGTLVDSMPTWQNLAIELLHSRGIKDVPEYVMEEIKTMTLVESSNYFIDHFDFDATPEELTNEMRELMKAHYENDIEIKPGVKGYLESLKTQGVKMCIASATPEPLIEICLRRLGIWSYFEFALSCETVKAGKSKPTVYIEASKRIANGIENKNVAIFEDSLFAARTAKKAGFYIIGVFDGSGLETWDEMKLTADETMCFMDK